MRAYLTPRYAALGICLCVSPVSAKSVSQAEWSGKALCWDNGNVARFLAGGKYSSTMIGDGTWRLTANGVEIHGQTWSGMLDLEKLPDGTFQSVQEGGGRVPATGKYCK
jgi:hypothetical protein